MLVAIILHGPIPQGTDQTSLPLELLTANPDFTSWGGVPPSKAVCSMGTPVRTCVLRARAAILAKSAGPPKPAVPTLSLRGEEPLCHLGSPGAIKNQLVKRALGNEG